MTPHICRWLIAVVLVFAVCGGAGVPVARGAPATKPVGGKLSSRLRQMRDLQTQGTLAADSAAQSQQVGLAPAGAGSLLRDDSNNLLLNVRVADTSRTTLDDLTSHGASIVHVSDQYRVVTVRMGLPRVPELEGIGAVQYAAEIVRPRLNSAAPEPIAATAPPDLGCNPVISEGVAQLKADVARATYNIDGTGVSVGALSDSYNNWTAAPTHAAGDVASGDLPGPGNPCGHTTPVQVVDDSYVETPPNPPSNPTGDKPLDEGRAMLQTVHDMAPEASLKFATAFTGLFAFADNILALQAAGARVITDDVTYFDEPFYQDGPVSVAANTARANGAFLTSSAGNDSQFINGVNFNGYESPVFRSTTCPAAIVTEEGAGVTCHNFNASGAADNTYGFTLRNNGTVTVELQWAEPWNGVTTDLDFFLINDATGAIISKSEDDNIHGSQEPFEILAAKNGGASAANVSLVVAHATGGTPRLKVLFLQNGDTSISSVEHLNVTSPDTEGSQIFGHNGAASELSMAAVPYNNSGTVESYSSRGPVTLYFGPVSGTTPAAALGSAQLVNKPDVGATDGAANTFFGQLINGTYRFYGTSDAAPHAAGAAALLFQYWPQGFPVAVQLALTQATPIPGFQQKDVGAGLINVVNAVQHLISAPPVFSSAVSTTFTEGTAGNFTVAAIAFPLPALTESGALPGGVTFTDHGDGTASLAGMPQSGTASVYHLTFQAQSSAGTAQQNFTLNVDGIVAGLASVTSPTKSFIVDTSATLGATITSTGGSTITERGVVTSQTSVNGNPTIGGAGVKTWTYFAESPEHVAPIPGPYTVPLPPGALIPSTNYAYRGYAKNAAGIAYSAVDTFTTGVCQSFSPSPPIGSIDSPAAGPASQSFTVSGWALALGDLCTGIDHVHVYIYPSDTNGAQTGPQVYFQEATFVDRPDVAAIYGPPMLHSGFTAQVSNLAFGNYLIVVYTHSIFSNSWTPMTRSINIRGPVSKPGMNIESPAAGKVSASFGVSGWAIDQGSASGTAIDQVHVYVYPSDAKGNMTGSQVFFTATTPQPRQDVANAFGAQFLNSGFNATTTTLSPGNYLLVVYAHSTLSNNWNIGTKTVQVNGPGMSIDSPAPKSQVPSSFLINGWAIDQGASTNSGVDKVHTYVYPADAKGNATGAQVFFSPANYGGPRPDVAGLFGPQFINSAYSVTTSSLPNGIYLIVVYIHSSLSQSWAALTRVVGVGVSVPDTVAPDVVSDLGEVPVAATPGVPPTPGSKANIAPPLGQAITPPGSKLPSATYPATPPALTAGR